MRITTYIFGITAIIFVAAACLGDGNLFESLSESDEAALEGMAEAAEQAEVYNDSLMWCIDIDGNCSDEHLHHLDSIYHHHVEEFEEHHHDYSHGNVTDDHHHSSTPSHTHGNGGHHDDEEDDHPQHTADSHHEMDELMEHHEDYHP